MAAVSLPSIGVYAVASATDDEPALTPPRSSADAIVGQVTPAKVDTFLASQGFLTEPVSDKRAAKSGIDLTSESRADAATGEALFAYVA